MDFIDSHAHLNSSEFKQTWLQVVQSAVNAGISTIINNGADLPSSKWGIEQAQNSPHVFATAGIHPELFLEPGQTVDRQDYNNLRRLIESSTKVVAIGEIGLDYTLDAQLAPPTRQHELLTKQLELAVALNLPVTLHVRDQPGQTKCFTDLIHILQQFTTSDDPLMTGTSTTSSDSGSINASQINSDKKSDLIDTLSAASSQLPSAQSPTAKLSTAPQLTGVFHCWTGTPNQIQQALALGFYVSFSGILTYKSAGHILEAAQQTPLDKILIETDAPYLTPEPIRSALKPPVNQPEYVIMTAEKLASIKNLPLHKIAEATTQNARRLFKLAPINND